VSLSERVLSSVDRARTALGDLVITATVTKTASVYDNDLLKVVNTTSTRTVQGFVSAWDYNEVDGSNVRVDDVKFYAFPSITVITHNDPVTVNGVSYVVVKVAPVMAGSRVALTQVQLRR